jgi:RNA polymerase subunit RPABC4/transcription elongation factor Spt4
MAKKKSCKKCKMFVEGGKCVSCGSESFSTSWQGRLFFHDPQNSMIAEKVHVTVKGEYAIKVR